MDTRYFAKRAPSVGIGRWEDPAASSRMALLALVRVLAIIVVAVGLLELATPAPARQPSARRSTREHGRFILSEAKDMDQALALAADIPLASLGTVEVRPILEIG